MPVNGSLHPEEQARSDGHESGFAGVGGTQVYTDDTIEIATGVALRYNGVPTSYTDTIAITVKGDEPHVLQFVSREIVSGSGELMRQQVRTTAGVYQTTTDPDHPNWNTDSAAHPIPYYDAAGAFRRQPGELTVYDQPALLPEAGQTWKATFKTFIVVNQQVTREVTWTRSQTAGESPNYSVDVQPADVLPDWARKVLAIQGYDIPL